MTTNQGFVDQVLSKLTDEWLSTKDLSYRTGIGMGRLVDTLSLIRGSGLLEFKQEHIRSVRWKFFYRRIQS